MAKKAWSVYPLVASWAGYWAVLAATTLAKPIALLARMSNEPPNTSDASFNFKNTDITASINSHGQELWSLHTSWFPLTLWIAGPPLLIWGVWVSRRSRVLRQKMAEQQSASMVGASAPAELKSGDGMGDARVAARDYEQA